MAIQGLGPRDTSSINNQDQVISKNQPGAQRPQISGNFLERAAPSSVPAAEVPRGKIYKVNLDIVDTYDNTGPRITVSLPKSGVVLVARNADSEGFVLYNPSKLDSNAKAKFQTAAGTDAPVVAFYSDPAQKADIEKSFPKAILKMYGPSSDSVIISSNDEKTVGAKIGAAFLSPNGGALIAQK